MYSLKEVLDALRSEPLTSALDKLEAFAAAAQLTDLAAWASAELSGYDSKNEDIELPEYRYVDVMWLNVYGRPMIIDFGDKETQASATHFLFPRGVLGLEPYAEGGLVIQHPEMQRLLGELLHNQWGDPARFAGAKISAQAVQGLLQRIRTEARRRVQQAIPTASAALVVRSAPDLTWLSDPALVKILHDRWREADVAQRAGAPLAATILLGSILEGALLHKAETNPAKANSAVSTPKETDASGATKPKRFAQWSLDNLINVAHEVGWLRREVKDFSVVLRSYRNFVHPGEQKRQGVTVTSETCDMCWPVVNAALIDLAAP